MWSAVSAVAALVAITVGFHGEVAAPALLALAVAVAIGGRSDIVTRWAATGLGLCGAVMYLDQAPPEMLTRAMTLPVPTAVSALASSVLLAVWAAALAWSWSGRHPETPEARAMWAGAGAVAVYSVTSFTVTAGVLLGGRETGFLAGHMAATICWIGLAAALFGAALRTTDPARRASAVAAGLVLTAAAMAKLLLFDLGTLDGMFRVVVFIVVGLVLLAMGAGYAQKPGGHARHFRCRMCGRTTGSRPRPAGSSRLGFRPVPLLPGPSQARVQRVSAPADRPGTRCA